ncbi:MAG: hypothetical protein ABI377_04240 [Devosia sp.]
MVSTSGKNVFSPLFWIEAAAALICALAVVFTLSSPDWIEELFHVDPDEGSGQLEWTIVVVLCVIALVFAAAAGFEWRRLSARGRA